VAECLPSNCKALVQSLELPTAKRCTILPIGGKDQGHLVLGTRGFDWDEGKEALWGDRNVLYPDHGM
jgi:hypothetical protein